MAILAVYNIKGGVGKTASAVNLAYLSAHSGNQTLLCDLDPQGSASYYFRVKARKKFTAEKLLKGGKHIEKGIRGTDYDNLDILPADFTYRNLDLVLDEIKKSGRRLKKVLQPLNTEYKHVFLDCPPNITLLSENIFHAADILLIPFIPTTLSMLSFEKLIDFFNKNNIDKKKMLILFSMVEKRKKMHQEMVQQFKGRKRILHTSIPYLADIEKMGIYREPVPVYSPKSVAGLAYTELWKEIECYL